MKTNVKAANTKPLVSLNVAVGELNMKIDGLNDSCLLTAIYLGLFRNDNELRFVGEAIIEGARIVAKRMQDHEPEFELKPPRKRKK